MKYKFLTIPFLFILPLLSVAQDVSDSITIGIDEIVVSQKFNKENVNIRTLPTATSFVSSKNIEQNNIYSLKDISVYVPNFFIPDYGSKLTSSIYIRGIGSRMGASAVSLYVDNVPYLNKGTFDFELYDIAGIQVLRGPQGTLYGQNSIGGIVNIYTLSPMVQQGTKVLISGGNYNNYKAQIALHQKINENLGFSVSGNYNHNGGFFENIYTNKKADKLNSGGARARLYWNLASNFKLDFTTDYDYTKQGGYAYGQIDSTNKVLPVNYNDPSGYTRSLLTNSLLLEHKLDWGTISSVTGYQYLNDKMELDQDFTSESMFTLNQMQKQHATTEEFVVKSNSTSDYQWTTGLFGFYQNLKTTAPVLFKQDGLNKILQPVFDEVVADTGNMTELSILDSIFIIQGIYKTPSYGAAIFHQSTFNNFIVDGLSVTIGLRFGIDETRLNHYTYTSDLWLKTSTTTESFPPIPIGLSLRGKERINSTHLLPKFAIKYEFDKLNNIYASFTGGYKAGGYNIQMFSDVVQGLMQEKKMELIGNQPVEDKNIKEKIAYNPERSWSYELGGKFSLFEHRLLVDAAFFYITSKDLQLTQFAPNGLGRIMKNAGKSASKGVEVSIQVKPANNLTVIASYGYAHSTFTEYKDSVKTESGNIEVDYKGNYVPLAPQHTVSFTANYTVNINSKWLDRLVIFAQYAGVGKIYWTEDNSVSQNFYGLLNGKITLEKNKYGLSFWIKNIANIRYHTFYFESLGNRFLQYGKPLQWGVDFRFSF